MKLLNLRFLSFGLLLGMLVGSYTLPAEKTFPDHDKGRARSDGAGAAPQSKDWLAGVLAGAGDEFPSLEQARGYVAQMRRLAGEVGSTKSLSRRPLADLVMEILRALPMSHVQAMAERLKDMPTRLSAEDQTIARYFLGGAAVIAGGGSGEIASELKTSDATARDRARRFEENVRTLTFPDGRVNPNGSVSGPGAGSKLDARAWILSQGELPFLERWAKSLLGSHRELASRVLALVEHARTANVDPVPKQEEESNPLTAARAAEIIRKRCVVCHNPNGLARSRIFPNFVTDGTWDEVLRNPKHRDHAEAQNLLLGFVGKVGGGVGKGMLKVAADEAKRRQDPFPESEQKALSEFINRQFKSHRESTQKRQGDRRDSGPTAVMVEKGMLETYRSALAEVNLSDLGIKELLSSPDIIYDHVGMPTAHQMPNVGVVNVPGIGIRALGHETPGPPVGHILDNRGRWLSPFFAGVGIGTDTVGNHTVFLAKLPRGQDGKVKPVVKWNATQWNHYIRRPDENHAEMIAYPEGTQFAEVRFTLVRGKPFVHTVLTRTKRIDKKTGKAFWDPDVFTPYPSADSFRERIRKEPDWEKDSTLVGWMRQLDAGGSPDQIVSRVGPVFKRDGNSADRLTGRSVELNKINYDHFDKFFKGAPLQSGRGIANGFGLTGPPFPKNYHLGAMGGVTIENCTNCHRNFGRPFRELMTSREGLASTSAYGNLGAGGDGINSFYIQDPSRLGSFLRVRDNRSLNPQLKGLVEDYDPRRHRGYVRVSP